VYYLFITDAVQCVDSVSFEIVADEVPIAGFSFSLSGQTLTMTNESQNAIAFEWSFGDGATSSESDPVHVYEDGGDYTVQLIVYGYCSNDTISQVIHVSGVRTKDIDKEESVVVFPNPNQGSFSVLSDSKDIDAVRIFDFLGREIQYRETGDGIYAISKAIDGMYLVLVTLEGATVVRIVQIQ
jgi:PKD repeat protein